ncbi:hypothetical protein RSK20926_01117 [Roseobacter sp. SK209-2-6]|nr:hypothetical protein RSK20926_01117 [Roseobacter sp. SK209-2-6]
MHDLATRLWPINRSITGNGLRQTLEILKEHLPELTITEVASGTQCFDWVVPPEWNVTQARLTAPDGSVVADIADHTLHLLGYSTPVDLRLSLDELQSHLYSLPDQPDAIPYMTSYYKERWGFCITDTARQALQPGEYHARIESTLDADGALSYGELVIPGESEQEIFISTYICHPSMANNELSGPVVATALAMWLSRLPQRKYTYRFVFIPETIGSIAYLSRNLEVLQSRVIAGFNVTCIGDERGYSYLASRHGDTLSDRVVQHVMQHVDPDHIRYPWEERGSDERQYCAPGIDLPITTVMRSKFGEYPEYHTSLDDLELVTPAGLQGGLDVLQKCCTVLEADAAYRVTVLGEPQLGKRGLYPNLSTKDTKRQVANMMNLISYSDGQHSVLDIAEKLDQPFWVLQPIAEVLYEHSLLENI